MKECEIIKSGHTFGLLAVRSFEKCMHITSMVSEKCVLGGMH